MLLINRKKIFKFNFLLPGIDSEIFLIRNEPTSKLDMVLSILHQSEFHHFKLEHIEDSYFKFTNGFLIHGLDNLVEHFSIRKEFLPCRLKHYVKGNLLPNSLRIYGNTLALHRLAYEGFIHLLKTVIENPRSPQINVKDSNGNFKILIIFYTVILSLMNALR